MPPWLPKINYAYHVNKHTVYFHLFVKSKAWFKLGGSFLPFVIQWLPVMVLSSLVASLLLVTVCHKAVVLLFHLTSFILRNNTHFKKYIKHTHTPTCTVWIIHVKWLSQGIGILLASQKSFMYSFPIIVSSLPSLLWLLLFFAFLYNLCIYFLKV